MELCKSGHEEICYEDLNCPMCDLIVEKDEEIKNLNSDIDDYNSELEEKENEIESLKEDILELKKESTNEN